MQTSNTLVTQTPPSSTVSLRPRLIFFVLTFISFSLVLISFIGVVILDPYAGIPYTGDPAATPSALSKLVLRFDVIHEGNIPSWFSGVILFLSALILTLIALEKRAQRDRFRWHWAGLALLFTLFSLDEVAYLHEGINNFMREQNIGGLELGWLVPAAVFVGLIGLLYIPFIRQLPASTRYRIIGAGGLFLTGALGLEFIDSLMFDSYTLESTPIIINNHLQDLFEMLGIDVFIYALLNYIGESMNPTRLVIR